MELALKISLSFVYRIENVPSRHDSPEFIHHPGVSSIVFMESCPFGLSGGP